jgi:AcrR family transcriptional regulator
VITTLARPRRTQAERSAATRRLLLDATVDCLSRLGYARTTTTEIVERAGVSRGAQLHHFPTKAELVTTAVEHLFERRHEEFVEAMARLPAGADRAAAAIDLLWSMVSGPTFYAWLELAVAARTDPELRASVAALTERFGDTIRRTFPELFPPPHEPNPFYDVIPVFIFALMDGLALEGMILGPEVARAGQVLAAAKQLAHLVMPPESRTED